MKSLKNIIAPVVLILVAAAIIAYYFREVIACPNCILFVVNYPYGEHIIYTDNQPFWSLILNFIDNHIVGLADSSIGIINSLMLVSLILCAVFVYKTLRLLELPQLYCTLFALLITFLSPQISRFAGHYSLAYSFYLPLFIWLFLSWLKNPSWKWYIAIIAGILAMGFTHLYYFIMIGALGFAFLLVRLLYDRFKIRSGMRFYISLAGIILLPALFLLGFIKLTDPVKDRPEEVYGMEIFTAKPEGTFLPFYKPFERYWKETHNIKKPDIESTSYVGVIGTLFLPFILFFLAAGRKKEMLNPVVRNLNHLIISAVIVWVYASGFLFLFGFEVILDIIPQLKQFRSLGRLAWVFYYIYTIGVAFYLYQVYSAAKEKKIRIQLVAGMMVILSAAVWAIEARSHIKGTVDRIVYPNRYLDPSQETYQSSLAEYGLKSSDFQAVFQLPLMVVGSDKILFHKGLWTQRESIRCAYETGLPIIPFNLSRSSVSQSLDLIQIMSHDLLPKSRLAACKETPILVLCESELISEHERNFLEKTEYIGRQGKIDMYKLEPFLLQQKQVDAIHLINRQADSISRTGYIRYDSYDSLTSEMTLLGSGALQIHASSALLHAQNFENDTASYELSFWFYLDGQHAFPLIDHQIVDKDGNLKNSIIYGMLNSGLREVFGNWGRVDIPFSSSSQFETHRFIVKNEPVIIDELLVKEKSKNVIIPSGNTFYLYNNYPVPVTDKQ
jgi:hypothetical protein